MNWWSGDLSLWDVGARKYEEVKRSKMKDDGVRLEYWHRREGIELASLKEEGARELA